MIFPWARRSAKGCAARARETRVLAENMTTNLHAYGTMLRIADEYERLADMAERENARNDPAEALPETS